MTRNDEIVRWAKEMHLQNAVVLDTEATGGSFNDEVIEVSVVRATDGEVLFHNSFKPTVKRMSRYAIAVHGKRKSDLRKCPLFPELHEKLTPVLINVPILAYNASFDKRLLAQSYQRYNLQVPDWQWHCVMKNYSAYKLDKRNVKLTVACEEMNVEGGDHTAINDALAAARLVWRMSRGF